MSFAIETTDLGYRPGKGFEISNLNMHVGRGSLYGFLGPNGAGKTTTIRLLLGLLKPQRGTITVLGHAMPSDNVAVLSRTGYVPERPHIYPTLTVDEALRLHSAFHAKWDAKWARELQAQFNLVGSRRVAALSKGETGKLMMLLALAQQPDLLVLDEPTDGLDPVVRRDVLEALLSYCSSHNATVLISSHLVHELERICDWIAVMDRGRLVAELPMQEFKDGIKRLSVANAPERLATTPFTVLARRPYNGSGEQWLVRGWSNEMSEYFTPNGATLREVVDLDLEEGFVELLRSFRGGTSHG
ncbi:MAG TPA: ABC transporter ATP-binding protein [Gemmatimonadaceae bacterium]